MLGRGVNMPFMFPFGYFSASRGGDTGTLDQAREAKGTSDDDMGTPYDPYPKAPPQECLNKCAMNYKETQSMLQLQMTALLDKIKHDMSQLNPKRGKGISESVVTIIFSLCKLLEIEDSTKYKACEIHDRFILKMNEDILKIVTRTDLEDGKVSQLEQRAEDLTILRIASCIQLASKMYSHGTQHRCVDVPSLIVALEMNHCYVTEEAVTKSEMRVLSLLGYNLNVVTALDVVELVSIQLGLSLIEYRHVYSIAIHALDHLYLKREELLDALYTITVKRNPMIHFDRQKFIASAESNKFVEGCAVVITALVLLNMQEHPTYKVLEQIVAEKVDLQLVLTLSLAIVSSSQQNADADDNFNLPFQKSLNGNTSCSDTCCLNTLF